VYRSATGTSDVTLYTGGMQSIPGNGYGVLAGTNFIGARLATLSNGLARDNGQLQLRNASDAVQDSMGYGTTTGSFVRGSAAPSPATGKSIGRTPNGQSTNNNSVDFRALANPSPGAAN
jgi:hypothetical protein